MAQKERRALLHRSSDSGRYERRPRSPPDAVLHTERATDFAELHLRIAERDIPAALEVEIFRENGHLLAHVQYYERSIGGLDERIDALLLRDARVEVARGVECRDPRHVESRGDDVRRSGIRSRRQELSRGEVNEPLGFEVLTARGIVGVVPGLRS